MSTTKDHPSHELPSGAHPDHGLPSRPGRPGQGVPTPHDQGPLVRVLLASGSDHTTGEPYDVPEQELSAHLFVHGRRWDHVQDAEDGTWVFAPTDR